MSVFIDTSAFLAILNRDDLWAVRAGRQWRHLVENEATMLTTSYVVLETTAILQRRIGMDAVRAFVDAVLPPVDVFPVDSKLHSAALSHLLVANRRELSLVDCCSFEIMRNLGVRTAFAFDKHFSEQGFQLCVDMS
ncbi:MAG: type II toxin-antitoxin system VapC family toxin [Lentisphaeria bacterium]|nr:type II toxin-antitoxin system VapC family toxin [Lentisphaeria bacterium]